LMRAGISAATTSGCEDPTQNPSYLKLIGPASPPPPARNTEPRERQCRHTRRSGNRRVVDHQLRPPFLEEELARRKPLGRLQRRLITEQNPSEVARRPVHPRLNIRNHPGARPEVEVGLVHHRGSAR